MTIILNVYRPVIEKLASIRQQIRHRNRWTMDDIANLSDVERQTYDDDARLALRKWARKKSDNNDLKALMPNGEYETITVDECVDRAFGDTVRLFNDKK